MQHKKLIDLTHTLSSSTPSWDGSCGFTLKNSIDYQDCSTEVLFRVQDFAMHAGIGTHIDMPAHCIPGGKTVADLPVQQMCAPCIVLDVSKHADQNYSVGKEAIDQLFEKHKNKLMDSVVLMYTGWEKYWNNPEQYRNNYQFPTISWQAAERLVAYGVIGVGIDTLGPDTPETKFAAHQILLSNNLFILENVANICALPESGANLIIAPLKIEGATEAPVRLLGIILN